MPIIPLPSQIEPRSGEFHISADAVIMTDAANRLNGGFLQKLLEAPTGLTLPIQTGGQAGKNSICLRLDPKLAVLSREGYRLIISAESITVEALVPGGVFYGIQSLRQLLPVEVETRQPVSGVEWKLACQVITDWPRFSWRGFMLDEGRHFQGKDTVLRTLDLMALQKLNVFHW
ncbi:MAG TPA: glycoside hydrolase family 20 zincin-like fold domain-containing protein, partial [Anaerolineales bacterium]|nr:glycoside hydrolase family 20 zincin-like fold domain-containing protein [Anaerolineales bacterium]